VSFFNIYGAGGLARELAGYLGWHHKVVSFIAPEGGDKKIEGVPVLSEPREEYAYARSVIAVGDPRVRAKIGADLYNLAEPILFGQYMGNHMSLGMGVVVCPGAILTTDISIDNHVYVNIGATIGHDADIGAYSILNPNCNVSGSVTIGKRCLIGSGATILQGVTLGDDVLVAAGAVVTKDFSGGVTLVGVPARPM
jgi:sugar O-acyltransferase (sialic acid O-acetyltransferase NeuD family)